MDGKRTNELLISLLESGGARGFVVTLKCKKLMLSRVQV